MLKPILTIIFVVIAYVFLYYSNIEYHTITYKTNTKIQVDGDPPICIMFTEDGRQFFDNQDVLIGKINPFSDTMRVGVKYDITTVGFDFLLDNKNVSNVTIKE